MAIKQSSDAHRGSPRPRNPYEIKELTPYAFEAFVAELLRLDGCPQVAMVGGSGDDGIDVRATSASGLPVVVQCKHVSSKIPPRQLREFLGAAMNEYLVGVAIFVTSDYFSSNARDFGQRHGIILVDMQRLVSWMRRDWSPLTGR
ncbi:restriction endonuclease [Streptomyces sp. ME01-24h]|nr:restriction endonuclease [Streptomyces sp. ME01-24h]